MIRRYVKPDHLSGFFTGILQQLSVILVDPTGRGDAGAQINAVPDSFSSDLHQSAVDLLYLIFKTVAGQIDPVGGKGRRTDHLGAGIHIGTLEIDEHLGMLADPFFCADALGHSGLYHIGTGGSVS